MPSSSNERDRWNKKYRESPGSWLEPDPFLSFAFSEYVRPLFPAPGRALDLAGGAGRHAIWLARQGWEVTLVDIAKAGIEEARQNAGPLASRVRCVEDDLTRFRASQIQFDVVMAFFYLDRKLFPEIVKSIRPGGLLVYKTLTRAQLDLSGGPKDPAYLLEKGELPRLAAGMQVLHYLEQTAGKATAELVARKSPADQT
ncbi:MAG: class I SAM-dependent methyltransferase [Terriglobales bacterium]